MDLTELIQQRRDNLARLIETQEFADKKELKARVSELDEIKKIVSRVEAKVIVKLADILKVLDDEEYTISVFGNCPIDDKIAESIGNNAIINFKQQLKEELISKFSE